MTLVVSVNAKTNGVIPLSAIFSSLVRISLVRSVFTYTSLLIGKFW